MLKVPEQYRIKHHRTMSSDESYGNNGAFQFCLSKTEQVFVIVSNGGGWEHVSAHVASKGERRVPTWAEMCKIKSMFWDKEATVIQFHPKKSEYVNKHPYVLHLWRPINQEIPTPDTDLI